jgi:CheY-like chemotaxis protein
VEGKSFNTLSPLPCRQILIVEDDVSIREALKELLEVEGYDALTACNGREGIEVLKTALCPCLILLDLMMPVMTGWEFIEEIKRTDHGRLKDNPVFVLSAVANEKNTPGVAGFLRKPMELESVLSAVKHFCGH